MDNHSRVPYQNTVFFLRDSISKIGSSVRRTASARLNAWQIVGTIPFNGRAYYNFGAK